MMMLCEKHLMMMLCEKHLGVKLNEKHLKVTLWEKRLGIALWKFFILAIINVGICFYKKAYAIAAHYLNGKTCLT